MSVVVLGLGVSGMAAARYLGGQGARVYISESRPASALSEEERVVKNGCEAFEGGGHTLSFFAEKDMIFVSPGVPDDLPVLVQARKMGIPVVGELALAAPVLPRRVIAVTGTNGKTTVTTLIGEFLQAAGFNTAVCGNIGRPLLDVLQGEEDMDVAVVEVSSFQLEKARGFRPDVGVLLNITPDHLDRHASLQQYVRAKAHLFANQGPEDVAILGGDNVICLELANQLGNVTPLLFGHSKECEAYICESEIYLRWQGKLERYELKGTVFDNSIGRLNCGAAILAARYGGAGKDSIDKILGTFQPLPHRMELVDVVAGIRYYNDSKATNTGAVISALHQARGRVVLIAGGRDKGDDYSLLREAVEKKVTHLILIGEAAAAMAEKLSDLMTTEIAVSLEQAVERAAEVANYGETVLLSPACASFDMFESYGHRGEVFRSCVQRLKESATVDVPAGGKS